MTSTVDASVWVAADLPQEAAHQDARTVIEQLIRTGEPIHQPTITLVEVGAAVFRRLHDERFAMEAIGALLQVPGITFHPLDVAASLDATALAMQGSLRGADAIYLATAVRTGGRLITLDAELRSRAPAGMEVLTPAEWVAGLGW